MEEGIKLLDRINPGWHHKIDLDKLWMAHDKLCILGQLYGDFWYAMRKLLPECRDQWERWQQAAEWGFCTRFMTEYKAFQAAWREVILSRRNQA